MKILILIFQLLDIWRSILAPHEFPQSFLLKLALMLQLHITFL